MLYLVTCVVGAEGQIGRVIMQRKLVNWLPAAGSDHTVDFVAENPEKQFPERR